MNQELLDKLRVISPEERKILDGEARVEKSIYTADDDFIVDSRQMLDAGKLIDIRPHTRFVRFPKHRHNYIEIIYMCSGTTTHIINESTRVVLDTGDLLFLNQNAAQEILPAGEDDIAVNFIVLPEFFDRAFLMMDERSELREFLDVPLKNYSSGMVARIAFAIATITKPDVLIADEILSVGDFMFQEKCEERMRQLMSGGTTVLLVSHSIGQIERMCDHVTWLEKGRVKMQGEAAEVCAAYKALDPEAAAIQNANSNKRIIEAP